MLRRWEEAGDQDDRRVGMRNRQALLRYPEAPDQALGRIREQLGLGFDDARREIEGQTHYPTRLDPALIGRETLDRQALEQDDLLRRFRPAAYRRLAAMDLSPERRGALLDLLDLPDVPGLVDLVVADLQQEGSGGFGSRKVHHVLTLAQLDACAERIPALLDNRAFVEAYLVRLAPCAGEDPDDPAVLLACLERLHSFADRLAAKWNTLKANALYRRLAFDRTRNVYDRQRFLAYLRLPRAVAHARRLASHGPVVDPATEVAGLSREVGSSIGDEEPLVRAYLHRFLSGTDGCADFAPFLEDAYLKEVHAEANLLAGTGDPARWQAMLGASQLRALRERVEVELLPTCKPRFALGETVSLDVALKNVPSLLVRVYEINTLNYYLLTSWEVDTDIDLDGLVPNWERTVAYQQPPMQRHEESFAFPEMDRPGVWVIELIGNGRSSRAVIRKGRLRFTERRSAAGHVFRIYDEECEQVRDASVWFGGQEYRPDREGEVLVPYSSRPGDDETVVLRRGDWADVQPFQLMGEDYCLVWDYWISREGLPSGGKARFVFRPTLLHYYDRMDIGILGSPRLVVTKRCVPGGSVDEVFPDVVLRNDGTTACEFSVPPGLVNLSFRLSGTIRRTTGREERKTVATETISFGEPALDGSVGCFHLRPTAEGYVLELLGWNGEPLPRQVVDLLFWHAEYARPVGARLQTDDEGRVWLGHLPGIVHMAASGAGAEFGTALAEGAGGICQYPSLIRALAGETVSLPFPGGTVERATLLSVGGRNSCGFAADDGDRLGAFPAAQDCRSLVRVGDGQLTIPGMPVGDYVLELRGGHGERLAVVRLVVASGFRRDGRVLLPHRTCPSLPPAYLGIREAGVTGEGADQRLVVRLTNATADTTVHVWAGRYVGSPWFRPVWPLFDETRDEWCVGATGCLYASGRELGDELRYVLDRRALAGRPGNMLARPSLLLAPRGLGRTTTRKERLREGTDHPATGGEEGQRPTRSDANGSGGGAVEGARPEEEPPPHFLPGETDFLPSPALVLSNLVPDADGNVILDVDLGGRQYLRVLATNARNAVQRTVCLPLRNEAPRDLRMGGSLPEGRHLVARERAEVVPAGTVFRVQDARTSEVNICGTLGGAYRLLAATTRDDRWRGWRVQATEGGDDDDDDDEEDDDDEWERDRLPAFAFVCRWPELGDDEKRTLYGEHSCHELDFFLHCKDRGFFDRVVRPHLANKRNKAFLDHWLLGEDVSVYLEPRRYGRLNVAERILLAQRLPVAQALSVRRQLRDEEMARGPWRGSEAAERFAVVLRSFAADGVGSAGSHRGVGCLEPLPPASGRAAAYARRARRLQRGRSLDWGGDDDADPGAETRFQRDRARRAEIRSRYREIGTTEMWAENGYLGIPAGRESAALIRANAFWRDYASHDGRTPFLSAHFPEASGSFSEMMMALAVLDLPFRSDGVDRAVEGVGMAWRPTHPIVVFHRQLVEAATTNEQHPVRVSQEILRGRPLSGGSRGQDAPVPVQDAFVAGVPYSCRMTVANPTADWLDADLVVQMPTGALSTTGARGARYVTHLDLYPRAFVSVWLHFYFPKPGDFTMYPVQVSRDGELLASASLPPSMWSPVRCRSTLPPGRSFPSMGQRRRCSPSWTRPISAVSISPRSPFA